MKILTSVVFSALLTFSGAARAQDDFNIDEIIPDLTGEERANLARSFGVYTSASTVFTGLNSVSGGNFTFESPDGQRDSELAVFRLPVSHLFGETGDPLRLMARGVLGHFDGTSSVYEFSNALREAANELPDEVNALPNEADFVKEEATSVSAGVGVQIEPVDNLTITPAFDIAWTHIRRSFDYNNFLSALYGVKFDREIFNTSLEAVSYVPSARMAYLIEAGSYSVTPSIEYSHLFTYDLWSKSSLADFSVDAGVLRSTIEYQISTPWSISAIPLGLHPFIIRTDVSNAAHEGLGFSYFYDIGLNLTFDTSKENSLFSQLRFGGAYIFGDDFYGYRIGVTAEI